MDLSPIDASVGRCVLHWVNSLASSFILTFFNGRRDNLASLPPLDGRLEMPSLNASSNFKDIFIGVRLDEELRAGSPTCKSAADDALVC